MTAPQNSPACKPPPAPAFHPEVCREGGRGRSRRTGRLRQTKGRLCEGTTLARLRPRAPRTRLRLTARTSPILAGRVRGARGLLSPPRNHFESIYDSFSDFQAARAVPHTARPRRDWPRSGCAAGR